MEKVKVKKGCDTCLYEYTCDWSPAENGWTCTNWTGDMNNENKKISEVAERSSLGNAFACG